MAREIKFRAYNIKKKVMYDWETICFAKDINVYTWLEANQRDGNVYNFLMQWTGLKDKNCVEIYEGDIVSFNDNDIGIVQGGVRGYCYDVVCPKNIARGWTLYHIWEHHNIEVIGNIHEHSELLGEEVQNG